MTNSEENGQADPELSGNKTMTLYGHAMNLIRMLDECKALVDESPVIFSEVLQKNEDYYVAKISRAVKLLEEMRREHGVFCYLGANGPCLCGATDFNEAIEGVLKALDLSKDSSRV